jgi:sulfate transport system permease protein
VMALIAVPLNTIFGISTALVLVRGRAAHPRLTGILDTLIDLPFLVSPVIIGLALTLVYGIHGWFGAWFAARGVQIIFAPTGMVLATVFVSLPFVVREVVPVLVEIGDDQEQAASTLGASRWQAFRRITLPSIRWGVAYGVILSTARALGEIGAVLVVSSLVAGQTLSLPLLVYQRANDIGAASTTGDYAAATELAVISLVVLLVMTILSPRRDAST